MLDTFFRSNGVKTKYAKGAIIVDCNEIPNGIYYLEDGYVKAFSLTERGHEHVHIIYKPGEIFPARWSFSSIKGDLTYVAMNEVNAWKAEKSKFTEFLHKDSKLLDLALEYSNTILDVFVNRVNDLEHMNAFLRVASRLVTMSKRFGKDVDGGVLIQAPVTQQDIASSLALSRESVSREISKLEQKGIIDYRDQLIYIADLRSLEREIKEYPE